MFMRGGSGRSTGTSSSSRSPSLREIDEDAALVDDGGGRLYVAVGKDFDDGKSNLTAALNLMVLEDLKLVLLLHVHQPAERVMSGFSKVPASQLEEKKLKEYRMNEQKGMCTLLNRYMDYCRLDLKVTAETLVIEKNNVANGILEQISQHHIKKLVMGTSSFSTRRKVPKSKVAAIVHEKAKPYCHISFICNESVACTREASMDSIKTGSPRSSSASSLSDETELPARSVSLPPGHHGYMRSPDQHALPQRSNSVSYTSSRFPVNNVETMSPIAQHSIHMTPTNRSLNSSIPNDGGSSNLSPKDLDSMNGSPASVSTVSSERQQILMAEAGMHNEVFEQQQKLLNELERARKEASEGRQKAERELFEASMMFKARENSLRKEKNEVEERLTREKAILEKENAVIYNELQKANEQRVELENKLLQTNSLLEELQQLQEVLQREKKDALREVEEMHKLNGNINFRASDVALIEFSYSEIKEATNDFDASKEIGHGGSGSVYKGFLRHTIVAIKKFNQEGTVGDKEFNDEVEILCRMRHPNLVTLIGVCRYPKVLVYEFLTNGSLEDHLQCKHHPNPLPWRIRISIVADICTALIFLHSNKPKSIAHGDLKPDNILLDGNFTGKLGDFGISRSLNLTNTTVTPYHRTDQIKGTLGYMDPGYITSGELTAQCDIYSFGVVLLRLLTGKGPLGLQSEVDKALSSGVLHEILDATAGEWPSAYAEELACLALKCCRPNRKERPDLAKEAWGVLQTMVNEAPLLCPNNKCEVPSYFVCPITQEIMRDPHIAVDGFTYEGEAIKDWIQRGHRMSPTTYLSLAHQEIIPNSALRFAIQEWQMRQKQ